MEEKEEENLAAPERAVLPPTPSGTTAEATQAALPPGIRPTTACAPQAVLPPEGPVLPPCLCTVYWAEPMYPFALTYLFVALDYIYSSTSS